MLLIVAGAAAIAVRRGKISVAASKRTGSTRNEKAGGAAMITGLVVGRMWSKEGGLFGLAKRVERFYP